MNWQSWSDFWSMGGHGLYVWGSTGVVLGAVAIELLGQLWQRRAILRDPGDQA